VFARKFTSIYHIDEMKTSKQLLMLIE